MCSRRCPASPRYSPLFRCATGHARPAEGRCAVVRMQLGFVELSVYPIGIGDRPLARVGAAEKGEFDPAIIVHFLDTPIAAVLAVPEYLGAEIVGLRPASVGVGHRFSRPVW